MRTIVSVQEINEVEIRPQSEVLEWRQLVESELKSRWQDRSSWISVHCPCCTGDRDRPAFTRFGVAYSECLSCGTLYAPERPSEDDLASWYRDSAPAAFWRDKMLVASRDTRYVKIVLPRAQWVLDGLSEYVPHATRLLDVSSNGASLVDAIVSERPGLDAVLTSLVANPAAERRPQVRVVPSPLGEVANFGPVDLITAVDAFDRASDLEALVRATHDALDHGGVLFATTPVASGFEIQSLWDRSPSVLPPDKLNLPTVRGLSLLFAGPSWELLELSTPGMFDVEMVRRTIAQDPEADWPRVLRAMVEDADPDEQRRFTEYLQSRRMSSFARLVARRVD